MIALVISGDRGEAEALATEIAEKQKHRIRGEITKVEIEAGYGSACIIAEEDDVIIGDKAIVSCRHITPEDPGFPENLGEIEGYDSVIRILRGQRGFFSGIWASESKLILFRDHVGHMPLAYRWLRPEAFTAALERWALGGGAEQLEPGHMLLFDGRRSEVVRWYEPGIGQVNDPVGLLANSLIEVMDIYIPKRCSLAFSGGLDSSIIAHLASRSGKDVDALVIGYGDCLDRVWAREAAELLGIEVREIIVDDELLREAISMLKGYLFKKSPMDLAIASIFYIASKNSLGDFLIAGQGPDELFGGYRKYLTALERFGIGHAAELMRRDVEQLHVTNLERDELASALAGSTLIAPYLAKPIYELALSINPSMKLRKNGGEIIRKWVLRRAAEKLGLPGKIVERPKKAAQYSSGIMKRIKFILSSSGVSGR
ncbi:MAG: asparagine synthase-related protein [Aigarchaeota archaeon]|nr:asparagine synthase-related protein [Aigarchaeota archaeon]